MTLETFEYRKEKLVNVLSKTKLYFQDIENENKVKSFDSLIESVKNGEFSIVVVGEFSAGKSTFLNALMEEKYLPSFTSETTATINYLQHISKSPNGHGLEVVFKDKTRKVEYGEATQHDIEKFVSTSSTTDVVNEVEYVNLYLDSPYLEKGVKLVDSPGLNGVAEGHAEVTERQIEKSHACIFMFNATQPGKKSDFEVLSKLTKKFNTVILVLNQIDKIKQDEETVEEVVERLKQDYMKYFNGNSLPEIWPLAAYPALVAKSERALEYPDNTGKRDHSLEDKEKYLQHSRIESFKERLWRFLTEGEKAQQEMLAPIEKAREALLERRTDIENQISNLEKLEDATEVNKQIKLLQSEIVRIEEEMKGNTRDIERALKEILNGSINVLKSGSQQIQKKSYHQIEMWDELEDIDVEVEEIQKKAEREFEYLIEEVYEHFMSEFDDLMEFQYSKIIESVRHHLGENENSLTDISLPKIEKLVFGEEQFRVGLERFEAKQKEIEQEINNYENKLIEVEENILKAALVHNEKQKLERDLADLKQKEASYINLLGTRPSVQYFDEEYEVEQARGGIFGWVADKLVGERTVQKRKRISDDSLVVEYEEKNREIRKQIKKEGLLLEEQIKKIGINAQLDMKMKEIERNKIERKKEELRQEREEYQKKFREDFQRKNRSILLKIKNMTRDHIDGLTRDYDKSLKKSLGDKRKHLSEIVAGIVDDKIRAQMLEKESELKELQHILNSSEVAKKEKIEEYSKQKSRINDLLGEVIALKSEISNVKADVIETSSVKIEAAMY